MESIDSHMIVIRSDPTICMPQEKIYINQFLTLNNAFPKVLNFRECVSRVSSDVELDVVSTE